MVVVRPWLTRRGSRLGSSKGPPVKGLTYHALQYGLMLTLVFSMAVWFVQSVRLIDLAINNGLPAGFVGLAALITGRVR